MAQRKQQQRTALKARLERVLRDTYHNATISYPSTQNQYEERLFEDWLQFHCESEIAYIQEGGAYGKGTEYWVFTNAIKKGKSVVYAMRLQQKYIREMNEERARCNRLDSRTDPVNALWECISDYGTLYTYGRGGRTLAPDRLCDGGSYSWGIKSVVEATEGMNYKEQVRLCMILESFNDHVERGCKDIPVLWEEYKKENDLQEEIDKHENMKPKQITIWV